MVTKTYPNANGSEYGIYNKLVNYSDSDNNSSGGSKIMGFLIGILLTT